MDVYRDQDRNVFNVADVLWGRKRARKGHWNVASFAQELLECSVCDGTIPAAAAKRRLGMISLAQKPVHQALKCASCLGSKLDATILSTFFSDCSLDEITSYNHQVLLCDRLARVLEKVQ